jgi:hypothetical protein
MKNITLIISCCFTMGYSQNAPVTLEQVSLVLLGLTTFQNGSGAGYSKVANPFPGGINSSATVGKFVAGLQSLAQRLMQDLKLPMLRVQME